MVTARYSNQQGSKSRRNTSQVQPPPVNIGNLSASRRPLYVRALQFQLSGVLQVFQNLIYKLQSDRRPRNWWTFILCISNRNNTQEPDSETRDRRTRPESDKQEQKNKSDSEGTIRERNDPRKNNFSTNPGNFSEHYIFLTQNRGYVLNTRTPSLI